MRAKRTDAKHAKVLEAIRALGYPCMSLHAHGGGLEDIIVGVPGRYHGPTAFNPLEFTEPPRWVLVEVKTIQNKKGTIRPSQFKKTQLEWYSKTRGYPRLIVTGPQDAVDQLRAL